MLDVTPSLTTLYVTVDDFCHSHPPKKRPGPQAPLRKRNHHLTIFAQPVPFQASGTLPLRPDQLARCLPYPAQPLTASNRLVRSCTQLIEASSCTW